MRVGYFADGPICKNSNGNYFAASYNDNLLSRYFCLGDELDLCLRVRKSENNVGLSKITLKNLSITECADIKKIKDLYKRNAVIKTVEDAVQRCDYIIVRIPSTIGGMAIKCCKRLNKKYLVEMVGCPWDSLWNHSWKGRIIALPIMLLTKHQVKHAPAVLYVTNEFLQKRYPTTGVQIGCSDVEFKESDVSVLEKRLSKIKNHTGKIVIGTTAAVNVKYKGQQYVIKALGALKKKGIDVFEYQLVGNGSQDYLKDIAKKYDVIDQVKFLGGLPHDEVFDWLDSIDIYAQPSKQEGLPRALVEAMSRGLPSFGANTGGIPELLDESCIFNKGFASISHIQKVLLSFDQKKMEDQARKNFYEAKEYDKDQLDTVRNSFIENFFKPKSYQSINNQ